MRCRFIALSCVCAHVFMWLLVGIWGFQCHPALCPYTLALYYLIQAQPSPLPRQWYYAETAHMHDFTDGLLFFFSPSFRLWLCTFTLSVAVCAVLLLPISILSNEVLLTFPQSYYMQWLNGSLIHGTIIISSLLNDKTNAVVDNHRI